MNLLLLGGTAEAREMSGEIAGMHGVSAIISLAGATRRPRGSDLPCRIGGFGGAEGFRTYLTDHGIDAVLDATHPFAAGMSERSWRVCQEIGVRYLQLLRPPWSPREGDQWTEIRHERDAVSHITHPSVVFLATGRKTLDSFSNLSHCRVICRRIDPPANPFPFDNGEYLVGRPPFSTAQEIALFRQLAVDWLVVKNAGGASSATKLDAARALGIPVLLVRRPEPLECPRVETTLEALDWVREEQCRSE